MIEGYKQNSFVPENELFIKEFESLGIQDAPEYLSVLISNFLKKENNVNSFIEVNKLLEANEPIAAFLKLSDQINIPKVKSSGPKIVRKNVNNLKSFINDIPKKIRNVPDTFTLGTHAHRIVENINSNGIIGVDEDKVTLLYEDGKVVGYEKIEGNKVRQNNLFINGGEKIEFSKKIYKFQEPLDLPKEENINEWLYSQIKSNLLSIYSHRSFPDKPFDAADILKNKKNRDSLLTSIQAAHILLNIKQQNGLSFWRSSEKNTIKFNFNEIEEYKALNWLTVLRQIVESRYRLLDTKPTLTELSLGEVKIAYKHELLDDDVLKINGGVADLIKFSWGKENSQNIVGTSGGNKMPLSFLIEHINRKFGSQSKKYNRISEDGIIYKRELYRNINSLFSELFDNLGYPILDNLQIELIDYKFPAGDGGWWTSFNVADLPYEEHSEKLNEYLFNIAAQFCWVMKWKEKSGMDKSNFGSNLDWENFGVSVNEIADFVFKNRLFEKIHGKLVYQTPEKDIDKSVSIPYTKEDFILWANKIIKRKVFLLEKTEQRIKRQKTLEMLIKLSNPTKTLETIRVSPEVLPDNVNSLFVTFNSVNYLVLGELENIIKESNKHEDWKINGVFYYSDQKIAVFMMEKVMEDGTTYPFRVAINSKAEFSIKGPQQFGFYRGVLTTSKELCGVREKVSDRAQTLRGIFNILAEKDMLKVYSTLTDSDKILLDGHTHPERKVENKPWVVTQDLMTGRWKIDPKALEYALLNSDYPGFSKISRILSQEKRLATPVMCPLPNHPNKDTEAANYYPETNSIWCFNCNERIYFPETRSRYISNIEKYSWPDGLKFDDYRGVSKGRETTINNFVDMSLLFRDDKDATEYLNSRGFEWNDFGQRSGYIPPEIINYLSKTISRKEFLDFRNRNRYQNIETIMSVFPDEEFENYWQKLNPEKVNVLKQILTVKNIDEFKNRALILRIREDKEDSLGGRIIVPSYWMSQFDNMLSLVPSNLIGRGIETKPGIYKGRKYYKLPMTQGKITGKRPTPPGVWVPDVSSFLLGYLKENLIIVFEGTTNAVSFSKMYPQYRNNTVVVEGTGYRNFLAFIDWLKFDGTICLAHDFDKGGVQAADRMKKQLELQNFKSVTTIHSLLGEDVIRSEEIPPFDIERFDDGDLTEYKKDMNDIYLSLIRKGLIKLSKD